VPICNPALDVACVGFQAWRDQFFGIVVTPWFMNVLLAPAPGAPPVEAAPGSTRNVSLPCGRVDFLVAELDGFGRLLMCSLFSPMQEFEDHAAALATAAAAAEQLLDVGALAATPATEAMAIPEARRETPAEKAERFRLLEEAEAVQDNAEPSNAEPPRLDRRALLRGGVGARSAP
jgi:[NiFe] hydrogenase assembly HybE family chaperone